MNSFSCAVPNGKYTAKLYFAETYEGITGPGQRVFSFNVQGHEFKDFDVFVKAGGANRAYVETVPVEVTREIHHHFTQQRRKSRNKCNRDDHPELTGQTCGWCRGGRDSSRDVPLSAHFCSHSSGGFLTGIRLVVADALRCQPIIS